MKLHIGCGNVILPGWVNCDTRPLPGVDVVCDAWQLPFETGEADEIYACHVLEHFGFGVCTPGFTDILWSWNRVLKHGGALRVSVPDLRAIGQIALRCNGMADTWNLTKLIYGGQEYEGNRHGVGFNRESLEHWLAHCGFHLFSEFTPFADDTSRFSMLGIPVSLNLQAIKK